ncbi:MAG: AAA family ATPase [Streptosporangiales bacterium]|nr:AAA family ATPase [Streptosporangiales bacterium]
MRVALLGPVEVHDDDGRAYALGGPRPRALLARLALTPGVVVLSGTLAADLWGDDAPGANALHTLVSRLRRALAAVGDDTAGALESHAAGYALRVGIDDVDLLSVEHLARAARTHLADGDATAAGRLAGDALARWRGEPLADVGDAPFAASVAVRAAELRLDLHDTAVDAAFRTGTAVDLTGLEARARAHPLRERLQVQLMRTLYDAGRQSDALDVYARTRRALVDELGVEPSAELGETHLAILRQDDAIRPRARATTPLRSALPAQLTSFVGREHELDRLVAALDTSRLVTVVGPGGAGKTRLATEAAARVEAGQRDGVHLLELAPVHEPAQLPSAVLAMLGMRQQNLFKQMDAERPQVTDAMERLLGNLATAHVLLVLDNCEHLVESAATFAAEVLAACPEVRILATSREPLSITGETLCPLPPLDVPPDDSSPGDAVSHAAVRLFVDRARGVRPDFVVTDDNVAAVTTICHRLDGMPLAIELAAARMRAMSPHQLADRLGDRFRLLTGGSRTAMARHQTLGAVVDWSWDTLDKPERLLLQRLAVFAGPVTLADVEEVCADEDLPRDDVFDVLAALVDKSLADPVGDADVRYRLLETIRAYAMDRLTDSGSADRFRDRHAAHVLDVTRHGEPLLRGPDQLRTVVRLDGLREDIAAALRWSIESDDTATATGLVAAAGWYWMLRGIHGDLRYWAPRADALTGDADPEDRAMTALLGSTAASADDTQGLKEGLRRGLAALAGCEKPYRFPMLGLLEPGVHLLENDFEGSLPLLADIIEDDPDPWTRTTARVVRSQVGAFLGDGAMVTADQDIVYDEYRALGDRWGTAVSLAMLADRHARAGEYATALDAYRRALDDMRALGSGDDVAQTLVRMAELHAVSGDFDGARAALADARELRTNLWWPAQDAYVDAGEADLAFREGRLDDAARRYAEAIARVEATPMPSASQMRVTMHLGRARVETAAGRLDEAAAALRTAYELAERAHDMPLVGLVVEGFAAHALAAGDAEGAARLLGATRAVFGTVPSANLDHAALVGRTRDALGDPAYDRLHAEGADRDRAGALEWLRGRITPRT